VEPAAQPVPEHPLQPGGGDYHGLRNRWGVLRDHLAAVDPPAGDYDWIFELFESESPDLADDSIITLGITELEGGWDGGPEETETDGEQTSSGSGPGVGAVGTAAAATGGAYLADRLRSED